MFVAGMVIFEKDEGTLDAQIVTPLRVNEYLTAKTLSLLIVVLMESAIVLFIGYGFTGYNPVLLLLGLVALSLGLTLAGFVQVSRYDSVTDFIVYAMPVILVSQLPLLDCTGMAPSPVWYVIPTMGPLLLLTAAFASMTTWQMVYALIYSLASVVARLLVGQACVPAQHCDEGQLKGDYHALRRSVPHTQPQRQAA